jgi:hypothetical protein
MGVKKYEYKNLVRKLELMRPVGRLSTWKVNISN